MQNRSKAKVFTAAATTVAIVLSGAAGLASADAPDQGDTVRTGVEGYLIDLEQDDDFAPQPGNENGESGTDVLVSETSTSGSTAMPAGMAIEAAANASAGIGKSSVPPDCSRVRILSEGTRGRYSEFVPRVNINLRLELRTNTFSYNPPNLDSCQRRWYYSKSLYHEGEITRNEGRVVMHSASRSANNEAYLSSNHNGFAIFNQAKKPENTDAFHRAVLRNNVVIETNTRRTFP